MGSARFFCCLYSIRREILSKLTDKIYELAKPVCDENNCSIWDVEYVKEAGAWYLRIYIDRDEGISINDCEIISRTLDPLLDNADLFDNAYTFEVSSAGAERHLKRPSDYLKFIDSTVEVKCYKAINNQKTFTGILRSYNEDGITVEAGNSVIIIPKENLASTRLRITDF